MPSIKLYHSYIFLFFRCPADSSSVTIIRNYRNVSAKFKLASFVWSDNVAWPIYIHCKVKVCDEQANGTNCTNPNPVSKILRFETNLRCL